MFDSKRFLENLTNAPGVYQMLDASGTIIYVGKAKNLKKRLTSYFRKALDSIKTAQLVSKIAEIKLTITQSENEAYILENNLIKAWRPRYNILFKDDKSYPYLIFSQDAFPRLDYIHSHKTPKGDYFGPFANGYAVKQSLQWLEKIFLLRNCSNHFFAHRSRPCLQYHIKRCSAPCVNYISQEVYAESVALAKLFLQGKNQQIITHLTQQMDQASVALDYERAAFFRDQIKALRQLDSEQNVQKGNASFDVIVIHEQEQQMISHVLLVREGKVIGSQSYFHHNTHHTDLAEALEYFIAQYYLNTERQIPTQVLVNQILPNQGWLSETLSANKAKKVTITFPKRGDNFRFVRLAETQAQQALLDHLVKQSSQQARMEALAKFLEVASLQRMECFDISHTFGEATVASCVVFDLNGPVKKDYRIFNIKEVTAGDDYAAMRQVLERRYAKNSENIIPDLVIIDGGKGQLQQAMDIFEELGLHQVVLLGIAKGPTRKAGLEVIWRADKEKFIELAIDPHSSAMHLLQQIRDEAHRFAITRHRAKRAKPRKESTLENIEGIGPKKRQSLLKHFGGMQGLREASVADIQKVARINEALAKKIHEAVH